MKSVKEGGDRIWHAPFESLSAFSILLAALFGTYHARADEKAGK